MTKEEYLLDTIEYYGADISRRCATTEEKEEASAVSGCTYSPLKAGLTYEQSEGCGIGRKLDREVAEKWDAIGNSSIATIINIRSDLFLLAPQWMQEMPWRFLVRIQQLHDGSHNWERLGGLSDNGRYIVRSMIEEFTLDETIFEKYIKE